MQTRKSRSAHGKSQVHYYNFEDAYGFRPSLPVLLYLSPWEFVAHWNVLKMQPPEQKDYMLTRWIPPMITNAAKELKEGGEELIAGTRNTR